MKNSLKQSFIYSILAAVYVALVATFMTYSKNIFNGADSALKGFAILILFSLSALVVATLLVGKPIMLYIDGKKKEAVYNLVASGIWLLIFLIVALLVLWLR